MVEAVPEIQAMTYLYIAAIGSTIEVILNHYVRLDVHLSYDVYASQRTDSNPGFHNESKVMRGNR